MGSSYLLIFLSSYQRSHDVFFRLETVSDRRKRISFKRRHCSGPEKTSMSGKNVSLSEQESGLTCRSPGRASVDHSVMPNGPQRAYCLLLSVYCCTTHPRIIERISYSTIHGYYLSNENKVYLLQSKFLKPLVFLFFFYQVCFYLYCSCFNISLTRVCLRV